ncbi:MAG: hypothetical protein KDJ22_16045 [Candidatus Competibacteraceae bacterium]|nr:hypothetical protein [Candidatus Competibacteraceae bacterium]
MHISEFEFTPGLTALQFLAHPMRGVAERAIHRQALQDREFARALADAKAAAQAELDRHETALCEQYDEEWF